MAEKKKILYIVEAMGGGVFTYIVDLSNELVNSYDMYIAYAVRKQTPENYKDYFDKRIHLIEVKNFGRAIDPAKDIAAFFEVKKIAAEIKPDIIHLHSSKAGAIGRMAFNGKIPMFYAQIQESDAQISCVDLQKFNDENPAIIDTEKHKTMLYPQKEAVAALFDESQFGNYMWNKLFRRELFDTIKFPSGKLMEDVAIIYLLFEQCDLISYCPAKLYFYYQRAGSILHKINAKLQMDWYSSAKERYFYIREKYPDMEENYRYFNTVVLCCYPYLQGKEAIYARQEFKRNWHYGVNASLGKAKFKAYLFRLSGWLYCKVWAIWQTKKT